jgi:hypothetical protein
MDHFILNSRNIMILILFSTSLVLIPETSHALARPLRLFWRRISRYHESMRLKLEKEHNGKFWEIDMTKLEP